jgi:hypothetical protein
MAENFEINNNSFYLPVSTNSSQAGINAASTDSPSSNLLASNQGNEASDISANSDQDQMMDGNLVNETIEYKPIPYHWFYTSHLADNKLNWAAMSFKDSNKLEEVYTQNK